MSGPDMATLLCEDGDVHDEAIPVNTLSRYTEAAPRCLTRRPNYFF